MWRQQTSQVHPAQEHAKRSITPKHRLDLGQSHCQRSGKEHDHKQDGQVESLPRHTVTASPRPQQQPAPLGQLAVKLRNTPLFLRHVAGQVMEKPKRLPEASVAADLLQRQDVRVQLAQDLQDAIQVPCGKQLPFGTKRWPNKLRSSKAF